MTHFCPIGSYRTREQLFRPLRRVHSHSVAWSCLFLSFVLPSLGAESSSTAPIAPPPLPDLGFSVLRLCGALIFVVALFLGGVWLFRRWQFLQSSRVKGPRLTILETHSLGSRQALHVVGYDKQRLLIGSSAAGIALVTHLPDGETEAGAAGSPTPSNFATAFQQVLSRKAS